MSEIAPPAPKRARLGSADIPDPTHRYERETTPPVSVRVLQLAEPICKYLNVHEVLRETLISDDLDFLKKNEHDTLWGLCDKDTPSKYLAGRTLSFLKARNKSKRDDDFCKFVACVIRASDHRGHLELGKIFQAKLGRAEWKCIQDILEKVHNVTSPLPSPYATPQHSPLTAPEKPIAFITLQGQLVAKEFIKTERELWFAFSTGDYNNVECLVETIQLNCKQDKVTYNVDCQVVAMWFQSLVIMHRDGRYSDAIVLLRNAERLANNSENEMILKGRIHQRIAQIYLMMHKDCKPKASKFFKRAKEELQFVGRGYDKTNMFCREAKILSATEPHRRDDIEKVYELALRSLEKDDPYFLASFPSVTLSKAAFHLHVAFGSPPRDNAPPPNVSTDDITKARETLKGFKEDEHILIDMRRNEYNFLQAELCRLEGNQKEAEKRFVEITSTMDSKVKNILSLASHRLEFMSQKQQLHTSSLIE